MRFKGQTCAFILLILAVGGFNPVGASESYTYSLGLLTGAGGSFDVDPDIGLGNTVVQFNFDLVTSARTHVATRLGRIGLGDDEGFGGLFGADLTYLSVAGEYRYLEPLYDSGIFLGLGVYQLSGRLEGTSEDEVALGLHLGVTGDFRINTHWSITAELTGHWADFDQAQLFATGLAGVTYHF